MHLLLLKVSAIKVSIYYCSDEVEVTLTSNSVFCRLKAKEIENNKANKSNLVFIKIFLIIKIL